MTKKVLTKVKIHVKAGQASPGPPVGTTLGIRGVNVMDFTKAFNERTADRPEGEPTPVEVTIYTDHSFSFIVKSPPTSHLLKQVAKIAKGASECSKEPVATITTEDIKKVAKTKIKDLNTDDLEAAMRTVTGTAKSMGIEIERVE